MRSRRFQVTKEGEHVPHHQTRCWACANPLAGLGLGPQHTADVAAAPTPSILYILRWFNLLICNTRCLTSPAAVKPAFSPFSLLLLQPGCQHTSSSRRLQWVSLLSAPFLKRAQGERNNNPELPGAPAAGPELQAAAAATSLVISVHPPP